MRVSSGDREGSKTGGGLTVAMPGDVVARVHLRHVDHGAAELEVRVQRVVQLEALARVRAVQAGVLLGLHDPVLRGEELGVAQPFAALARLEERAQHVVRGGAVEQRVDEQRALARRRRRHAQPALEHAEHAARAGALVVVADGREAAARLPRVVRAQVALEDRVVHAAQPVAFRLPPLDAAAVAVRAQREPVVARVADAQPVAVRHGVRRRDQRGRVFAVPELHEEGLRLEEVRVRARLDLRRRPVELVDLWVVGWEGCFAVRFGTSFPQLGRQDVGHGMDVPFVCGFFAMYSRISAFQRSASSWLTTPLITATPVFFNLLLNSSLPSFRPMSLKSSSGTIAGPSSLISSISRRS